MFSEYYQRSFHRGSNPLADPQCQIINLLAGPPNTGFPVFKCLQGWGVQYFSTAADVFLRQPGVLPYFLICKTENLYFWSLQPLSSYFGPLGPHGLSLFSLEQHSASEFFLHPRVCLLQSLTIFQGGSRSLPFLVSSHELGLVSAQTPPPILKLNNRAGVQASVEDSGL